MLLTRSLTVHVRYCLVYYTPRLLLLASAGILSGEFAPHAMPMLCPGLPCHPSSSHCRRLLSGLRCRQPSDDTWQAEMTAATHRDPPCRDTRGEGLPRACLLDLDSHITAMHCAKLRCTYSRTYHYCRSAAAPRRWARARSSLLAAVPPSTNRNLLPSSLDNTCLRLSCSATLQCACAVPAVRAMLRTTCQS